MNLDLLKKVQLHILQRPTCLESSYCRLFGGIATWTCLLDGEVEPSLRVAQSLLELSGEQASRLFTSLQCDHEERHGINAYWPGDLAKRYEEARSPAQRANVIWDRIDRFMATGGSQ